MPDQADITIVSDKDYFLFKPNTIYIPFGLDPRKLLVHLSKPVQRRNINLINASAREIDPISRRVYFDSHTDLPDLSYDYLVVATGAEMRPGAIPGMSQYSHTISTTADMLQLREAFHHLLDDPGRARTRKVLFLVPPNNKCSGPLYEMAIMLDTWLKRKRARHQIDITWSTYEESYLQAFGPRLHEVVTREFQQRNITGYNSYVVDRVEKGQVVYKNDQSLPFDLLVSFPPYEASSRFLHLPIDERGFIATNLESRQVVGYPGVYAVGDASDFPVKQAFLAFLQADAAADHLSAEILGTAPAVAFEPSNLCISDESDDYRLPATGNSEPGTRNNELGTMRPDVNHLYKVGSSPIWRLGKMALGLYLPWRFKADNPFYANVPWKGIEAGVKLMSGPASR